MPKGEPFLTRIDGMSFDQALAFLETKKVVRNAKLTGFLARIQKKAAKPVDGTYQFAPGMTWTQVLTILKNPVRQMVRVPEGWWIARTAKRLEEKGVCSADDYTKLANDPSQFEGVVSFPLPKKSLEGYLYPDTYDFPPLLGAKRAITMQLKAFESKVVKPLGTDGLWKAVVEGSLVETEVAVDAERPIVAGVIENRIAKKMRLQLDATVLYALQKWRKLGKGEVLKVDSPYNTYLHGGLPPGPICSPSYKSIEAAMHPATHQYLYYVRGEGMTHLFGKTYSEHVVNIGKSNAIRKREAAELAAKKDAAQP